MFSRSTPLSETVFNSDALIVHVLKATVVTQAIYISNSIRPI